MLCYCTACNKEVEAAVKKEERTYKVRGIEVKCLVKVLTCKECQEELYDYKTTRENDRLINDEYKKAVGLLTSGEIKSLRLKTGLSQKELSDYLGVGGKTLTRYENGSIQDRAFDNLLRMVISYKNSLYPLVKDNFQEERNQKNKAYKKAIVLPLAA